MILKRLMSIMILISVLLPVTVALTEDLKKIQNSFADGFDLGQLYILGLNKSSSAKEYNALAQKHNDYVNETYGGEAKNYLIKILPMPSAGNLKIPISKGDVSQDSQINPDMPLFVPKINAIREIQISKVLRPLGDGIRIG
jgi:hypothetical protein